MSAIRLARAVTGREKMLKFAGAYHGHVDGLLAQAGLRTGHAGNPGQSRRAGGRRRGHRDRPVKRPPRAVGHERSRGDPRRAYPGQHGGRPAGRRFLELLRAWRTESGALLIFDEVITGFRVARGGAQELYGVLPDLTIMGKISAGGLPAAAYGGRRVLMERIAPAGDVYQAGTLSGNPLAVAAALATLRQLDDGAYERLATTTDALANGLRDAAAGAGRAGPERPGSAHRVLLREPGPRLRRRQRVRHRGLRAWCRGLLARDVYPPPSQFEAWFPSLAHTERTWSARSRPPGRRSRSSARDENRPRRGERAPRGAACRGGNGGRRARRPGT